MGFQQLKSMIEENRKAAEQAKEISECPECGFNGLKQNSKKELLCPICGWTNRR
jgi:predicted RNA-binding Zn-ribbon protein involved in translation (DUF1610 family)